MEFTELQQDIGKLLQDLPLTQQAILDDLSWENIVADIAETYKLDNEETLWLYVHTGLLLAQARDPEKFYSDLQARIQKPKETIQLIASKILNEIIIPLGNQLVELLPADEKTPLELEVEELLSEDASATKNNLRGYSVPKKRTPLVPQKPKKTSYDGSDPYHEDFE